MVSLGVTGGIGSGKTYVVRIFTALGIPCYDSDSETKQLYTQDPGLKQALIDLLGPNIFPDGRFDRNAMARLIFGDKDLLKRINALVHPCVWRHFEQWANRCKAPYVVFESALLLETQPPLPLTRVLTLSADESVRLHRAGVRDAISEQVVRQRMCRQWTDAQREAKAHFLIVSNEQEALLPRVLNVHACMMALSNTLKTDSHEN